MRLHQTGGARAAFLLTVLAGAGIMPGQAMAYDCDALVVDHGAVLGADIGRVEAAAQKLVDAGALVRVRTVQDFGGFPDLDAYETDYWSHCKGWQSLDGQGDKSTLLALFVSFDDDFDPAKTEESPKRDFGFYHGDAWKTRLGGGKDIDILRLTVAPKLRDGDNASALAAGLIEAVELIRVPVETAVPQAARTSSPAPAPVVVVQQPAAPAQPADLSGLWSVMWGVLGLVVVGGGAVGIVSWRRRVDAERAAQQKARHAQQECVDYVNNAEQQLVLAEAKVNGQAKNFADADIEPLRATLATARRQLMAAQTEYGSLQGIDADPDKPGLTVGEYDNIRVRYEALLAKFTAAVNAVSGIDAQIDELVRRAAAANAEFDAASGEFEQDATRVAAVEGAGFRISQANTTIQQAFAALQRAETAKNEKAFDRVSSALAEAKRLAKEAAEQAEAVPRGKSAIDQAVAAQREQVVRVDGLIDRADEAFGEMSASYARASWNVVAGNGSQAEGLVTEAEAALDAAVVAANMETQDWDGARAQIARAAEQTNRAQGLAEAIVTLKRDLDAAKAAAPGEIDAAAADIASAQGFVATHKADVDDAHVVRLVAAERALGQARDELAKAEPDYLAVVKVARSANEAADAILAQARSEHEAAERLRQRDVTSMREAERSLDAASRYIENNPVDVDDDARQVVEGAAHALANARAVSSPDEKTRLTERVRLTEQADKESDRALEMAQTDVARRAQERESANRELGLAEADIEAARGFILRNDADIGEDLETRLDEAARALVSARQGLNARKPDYLAVVRAAQAVNAAADSIFAKAKEQHDAAERLRQRAASELAEGGRSVDAANQYIASRRSDVDSDAEALARSAESALSSARRASTPEEQIRYGQQANQEADRALEMAKDDVRREERRRQEARDEAERQARAVAAAAEAERRRVRAAAEAVEAERRRQEQQRQQAAAEASRAAQQRAAASTPSPTRHGGSAGGFGGAGRNSTTASVGRAGRNGGSAGGW